MDVGGGPVTPEEMVKWLEQQQAQVKTKASEAMQVKARKAAEKVQTAAAGAGRPVRVATRVSRTDQGAVLQVGYGRGFPGKRVAAALVRGAGDGEP